MKTKGLSLAEAHDSGKKYRRPKNTCLHFRYADDDGISIDDALATDYELEPQAKLLTREEVEDAFYMEWVGVGKSIDDVVCAVLNRLFGSEEDV